MPKSLASETNGNSSQLIVIQEGRGEEARGGDRGTALP